MAKTTDSWFFDGNCKNCGSNIVVCQAKEKDYLYYCSQKNCVNHKGVETYDMDDAPDFITPYTNIVNHKDGIFLESKKTLEKYIGTDITQDVLTKIREDLEKTLNKYFFENDVYKDSFPITFENELGMWKILDDGNIFFQSKSKTKFIEINMTILPTGAIFN